MSGQVSLSDEQQAAVDSLISGVRQGKRTQTLGGYAGTGKTTLIRHLMSMLIGFVACAYTGRAACVLRRKGVPASTIHSLIYVPVKECEDDEEPCKKDCDCPIVGWRRRGFLPIAGFLVDESSMVSEAIYRDMMAFGFPAIFVGDHGQLPPVEAERTGFNLMANPDIKLETIQRHAGDIPRFAEHLRNGHPADKFRPQSDAVVLLDGDLDDRFLLEADQVIVATNKMRVGINAYVREKLGKQARIEVGERVICLRNHRIKDLQNGMHGTVRSVVGNQIDIDTDDGPRDRINVDMDQFGREKGPEFGDRNGLIPFDYAYAITCHKAQGGEWPTVLVIEERCGALDHRRWAYTAASRAQERLWWKVDRPTGRGS